MLRCSIKRETINVYISIHNYKKNRIGSISHQLAINIWHAESCQSAISNSNQFLFSMEYFRLVPCRVPPSTHCFSCNPLGCPFKSGLWLHFLCRTLKTLFCWTQVSTWNERRRVHLLVGIVPGFQRWILHAFIMALRNAISTCIPLNGYPVWHAICCKIILCNGQWLF